jgi:hypothetical protein
MRSFYTALLRQLAERFQVQPQVLFVVAAFSAIFFFMVLIALLFSEPKSKDTKSKMWR